MFHHEEILRGEGLRERLAKHVTVCGVGALGSNLVDSMIRQGFTKIRVIDMDRVETHNIGTQTFEEADIGQLKAASVQNKAFRTASIEIEAESKELKKGNIKKLFKGTDLVIDCFDNSASRQMVQDYCREKGLECLHAGMEGEYGEVAWDATYKVPDDGGEDNCDYPLARNLVMFIVAMTCEEIVDFCLESSPRQGSWSFTLKDMAVRSYR
jgi:molybdopterin/thiamine biosynthesis adenylyltransferase